MRPSQLLRDRRVQAIAVVALLVLVIALAGAGGDWRDSGVEELDLRNVMGRPSQHVGTYDHVVVDNSAPILAAAATPLACWYDKPAGTYGLVPLLVEGDPLEEAQQARVKGQLGLSSPLRVEGADHTIASTEAAMAAFERAAGAVVVEVGMEGYAASLEAATVASYLDIPVLVREGGGSDGRLRSALRELGAGYVVLAGPFEPSRAGVAKELGLPYVPLAGEELTQAVRTLLADRFGRTDYGVLTNPRDVVGISCEDIQADGPTEWEETGSFNNVQRAGHLRAVSTGPVSDFLNVPVEPGIHRLLIQGRVTRMDDPLGSLKDGLGIAPIMSLWLEDSSGELVAYGSSIGYREGEAVLDVTLINVTEDLMLRVSLFYGIEGRTNMGTMGQGWDGVGWSRVSADWEVAFSRTPITTPMVGQLPGLSRLAPYLAAAHGGFLVADGEMAYLDEAFAASVSTATGPWYDATQHAAVNERVDRNADALRAAIDGLAGTEVPSGVTLYDTYISGPAWLAMLGDAVAIPQAYVEKDPSWEEDVQFGLGWASDEPYRIDGLLSIGRPLSTSVAGVSTLVARTLFYQDVVEAHTAQLSYPESNDWGSNYLLLFGEGGGQTGGLFWQRPFADELRGLGWNPEQYGDTLENDRQTMVARGAYERANYMEVMLHGNWYWYVPEMNGPDEYSTSVKVMDVMDWEIGPSFFISAACLMGRVDGVPADQSIGLAFIHAGANAFVGATRSTGSESGTRWMEWSLLYDDTSVGEAHRESMEVNPEEPTVWVRTLFADPAFNPYEPGNGYSGQGRPVIEWG